MIDPSSKFPSDAFIAVSLAGLSVFSVMIGANVAISDVATWLGKSPDNLVTLIGSALVGGGLLLTARTIRADTLAKLDEARSRRVEQYAERIREFRTLRTNAAIMMLLNFDRDIVVQEGERPERICWSDTAWALVPAYFRHYMYEPKLTVIRDCFNDLLEGMSRLHFLLTQDLVRQEDVDHICRPLLDRIVREPVFSERAIARNLRLYILWRNPRGVLHLCDRYGLPIRAMREADVAALLLELNAGQYGPWELTGWGSLDAPSSISGRPLG